jgi:hypothetical protein
MFKILPDRPAPTLKWCEACQKMEALILFGRSKNEPMGLSRTCRRMKNESSMRTAARHRAGHGVRGKS